MTEFDDAERRALFSARADEYLDGRPGYPPPVFEHLRMTCGLGPESQVLEVGPGAGQATGPVLDAGADVVAVELGDEFATLLSDRFAGRRLVVRVGAFETIDLPRGAFDIVMSATAFHWVPARMGLERAADALRVGGRLALWWNHYGDPERPDPFRDEVQTVLARHAPELTDAKSGGAGIGAHGIPRPTRRAFSLRSRARCDSTSMRGRHSFETSVSSWTRTSAARSTGRF